MTSIPYVVSETTEIITGEHAAAQFAQLSQKNSDLSQLDAAVSLLLGGTPDEEEAMPVGVHSTSVLNTPVQIAESKTETNTVESLFIMKAQSRGNTEVARCSTFLRGGTHQEGETFLLKATAGGYLDQVDEFVLSPQGDGRVMPRDGWWNRLTGCLSRESCGSTCLNAAITCPKVTWPAFLICLAGRCGGCIVKCAACATCDCGFWCKWATGCCNG